MHPSSPPPVTADAVVEEAGRGRVWRIRTVAAAAASVGLLVAAAATWEYGRRAGSQAPDTRDILFFATLAHLGGTEWLRRRPRRGDLRWHRSVPLPGGPRPGLFARSSRRALALDAVGFVGIFGSGLVWAGSTIDGWVGRITTALCVVAAPWLAVKLFKVIRQPGHVAITAEGVVFDGDLLRWDDIRAVRRTKHGVHLVLRPPARWRRADLGGPDCAVSDERLAQVIEHYRATPRYRTALDAPPSAD